MLDPKEEARFDELKTMCRELKVPSPPEIMIGLKVHEGGVLTFYDIQRGHSWVRNYWNMVAVQVWNASAGSSYAAGSLAFKNVGGGIESWTGYWLAAYQIIGSIHAGTSDAAFALENYALGAVIVSGNGAGQLLKSAMTRGTPAYNGGTKVWSNTLACIWNNNSGNSITVKETGLGASYTGGYPLMERSVLSPTVAVANGAQLTVTYTISMDFSAID
jgi:hypothetical protein